MLTLTIELQTIVKLLLIHTRISTFFLWLPIFSIIQLPLRIRIALITALSLLMSPHLSLAPLPEALGSWVVWFGQEVIIGSVLAFGVLTALAALQLGGRWLDLQMGFGVATMIDPTTRQQTALIGSILGLMGLASFVLAGGHRLLLQALHHSFVQIPLGSFTLTTVEALVAQFGLMFVLAALLVMPVLVLLLLLDALMAIAARTMPQLNIFILSIPVKIVAGTLMLAAVLHSSAPVLNRLFESIFVFFTVI